MKNETICECGHLQEVHGCDARDLDSHECKHNGVCGLDCACTAFTAAKSLRDEMFEATDYFLLDGVEIWRGVDEWIVSLSADPDTPITRAGFDTPEAAFAWLKDHLKEEETNGETK